MRRCGRERNILWVVGFICPAASRTLKKEILSQKFPFSACSTCGPRYQRGREERGEFNFQRENNRVFESKSKVIFASSHTHKRKCRCGNVLIRRVRSCANCAGEVVVEDHKAGTSREEVRGEKERGEMRGVRRR